MKSKHLILALMMVVAFSGTVGAQVWPAAYVDCSEIEGLDENGLIPTGGDVTLTIPVRLLNMITDLPADTMGGYRTAISNGYYFYSDNGVTVGSITFEKNCAYKWDMECAFPLGCYPWLGCYSWFDMYFGATVISKGLGGYGVAGLANEGDGLPPDFNGIGYKFILSGVNNPGGGSIVMDTTYWEPGNFWLWTALGDSVLWGGGPDGYEIGGVSTEVAFNGDAGIPNSFALNQNYPNPFNPSTTMQFDVARRAFVRIEIYNILGQQVKTLVNEEMAPGTYTVIWNGVNDAGEQVSSGVYLCNMKTDGYNQTVKMMMLR